MPLILKTGYNYHIRLWIIPSDKCCFLLILLTEYPWNPRTSLMKKVHIAVNVTVQAAKLFIKPNYHIFICE